jgi:heat shock protein HtpX
MMGVKLIDPNAPGAQGELVRTVHNLARAARLPAMPEVGIYESPEVNAFATGPTKKRALVAVSSGLLQKMNRDEVEGVLAHEVAHIANGDMVTMTLIQGIVNAFVMFFARIIAFAIGQALASRSDDRDSRPSPMLNYLIIMVLEIVFSILGMIVVAFFSRWREYRADTGGATLAGRQKMISALQSLQRTFDRVDTEHSSLATLKINGKTSSFAKLFSTHPPLEERIRKLQMSV